MIQFVSNAGVMLCLAGAGMGAVAFYFPDYRGWVWLCSAAALFVLGLFLIARARRARGDDKFDWSDLDGPDGDLLD